MQKKLLLTFLSLYSSISWSLGFSINANHSYFGFVTTIVTITNNISHCEREELCIINEYYTSNSQYSFYLNESEIDYFKIKTTNNFSKYILRTNLHQGENYINILSSNHNKSNSNILDLAFSDSWSNDIKLNIQGVEPTVIKFSDKFLMFFRGNSDANTKNNIVNYAEKGIIKYSESFDGVVWSKPVDLISDSFYQGQPFVFFDNGKFHLFFNDGFSDGKHNYQYWSSLTGLPGSFILVNKDFLRIDYHPGNINVFKNNNKYYFFYESLFLNRFWAISKVAISKLVPFNDNNSNPVINFENKMLGGPEIFKVNNTFYMFAHQGEDFGEGNMPTSLVRYKSNDLIKWTKDNWELLREGVAGIESQIADPTIIFDLNNIFMYYEELLTQEANKLPDIRLVTVNKSANYFFDSKYTKTKGADLKSEGWIYEEFDTINLDTVCRKSSKYSSSISDNALYVKTGKKSLKASYLINLTNKELFFSYKNNDFKDSNTIFSLNDDLISIVSSGDYFKIKYNNELIQLCKIMKDENFIKIKVFSDSLYFNCVKQGASINIVNHTNIKKFGLMQEANQFSIYSGFIVNNLFTGINYEIK